MGELFAHARHLAAEEIANFIQGQLEAVMLTAVEPTSLRNQVNGVGLDRPYAAVNVTSYVYGTIDWIAMRYGYNGLELGARYLACAAIATETDEPTELPPMNSYVARDDTPQGTTQAHQVAAREFLAAVRDGNNTAVTQLWDQIMAESAAVMILYLFLFAQALGAARVMTFQQKGRPQ